MVVDRLKNRWFLVVVVGFFLINKAVNSVDGLEIGSAIEEGVAEDIAKTFAETTEVMEESLSNVRATEEAVMSNETASLENIVSGKIPTTPTISSELPTVTPAATSVVNTDIMGSVSSDEFLSKSTQSVPSQDAANQVASQSPNQTTAIHENNVASTTNPENKVQFKTEKIQKTGDAFSAKVSAQTAVDDAQKLVSTSKEAVEDAQVLVNNKQVEIIALQRQYDIEAGLGHDVTSIKSDLDKAQSEIVQAKTQLDQAKEALNNAKSNLTGVQRNLDIAKTELKNSFTDDSSGIDNLKKVRAEFKEQLKTAQDDLVRKQNDFEEFKKTEPVDPGQNASEEEKQAYSESKQQFDSDFEKRQNDIKTVQKKVKDFTDQYNAANKEVWSQRGKYWKNTSLDYGWKGLKFLGEQIIMSVAFSIAPEIFQYITQKEQNEALYKDITSQKTFAGIKMQIPSGLVPSGNPSGGVFLYYDVQPEMGQNATSAYLRSEDRHWFVSCNPTGYENPGKYYIGAAEFPEMMLDLSTGLIFDASGSIVAPYYHSNTPFTFPVSVALDDQTSNPSWISGADKSIEKVVNSLQGDVSGNSSDTSYQQIDIVNSIANMVTSKLGKKAYNADASYLFTSTGGVLPPILNPLLMSYGKASKIDAFGTPFIPASGSNKAQSAQPLMVQEYAGIGELSQIFGVKYFELFGVKVSDNGQKIITALQNAKVPANIKDITINPVSQNLLLTDPALNHAIADAGAANSLTVGFDPQEHILAHGLPIYQTDSTPTAQFLRNFVTTTSSVSLADYVHDVVMALDGSGYPTLALIPSVNSLTGRVELVTNPSVRYITSLISGVTYQPNNGYNPIEEASPNKMALSAENFIKGCSAQIKQQIAQMRILYNNAVIGGPFVLSHGLYAYRVSLSSMMQSKYDGITDQTATEQTLSQIAQGGIKQPSGTYTLTDKLAKQADAFVYAIPNALDGLDAQGKVIKIPDYVIPVTIDTKNIGNYLMVPLGSQALSSSGAIVAYPSTQVQALISLVTSKFYTADYIPSTALVKLGDSNSAVSTTLGTEFMETEVNPVNFDAQGNPLSTQKVFIPSLYFMNIQAFSYCDGLFPLVNQNSTSVIGADFISGGLCNSATALEMPLTAFLPEMFTGLIPGSGKINSLNSSGLTATTVGDYAVKASTDSSFTAGLLSVETGDLPSIYQVHQSWISYMRAHNDAITRINTAPVLICNNNGFSDWALVATGPADVKNGNFFYYTNKSEAPGLWVVAKYNGTSNQVAGTSVSIANFSSIGANAVDLGSSANALINVGTGEVLVKITDATTGRSTMSPLMRYSVGATPVSLGRIILNPQDIVTSAGKTALPALQTLIKSMQGNNSTDGTIMGPYKYGSYTLTIDRQSYNDGNYIYTAKDANGVVKDYLITFDVDDVNHYNKPFSPAYQQFDPTQEMISMVNGNGYTANGVVTNYGVVDNRLTGLSIDPSKAYEYFEGIVQGISGISINQTLSAAIQQLAISVNETFIDQTKVVDDSTYPTDAALALVQATPLDVATLNQQVPLVGTDNQLIEYQGKFYLRSALPIDTSTATPLYMYYQFNVAPLVSDTKNILTMPTGVFYDQTGKATSVLMGSSALKLMEQYGLSINPTTNALTQGLPVEHHSLPMTSVDTSLGGGKEGYLMRLMPGTTKVTTPTANYYFYKNIFHAGASVSQLQSYQNSQSGNDPYAPYDLLLQVNPVSSSTPGYYASLLTGITYGIDGKQLYENNQLYFQNVNGTPSSNLPLVVWGDDIFSTRALVGTSTNSSAMNSGSVEFNTYEIDRFGLAYEYVDSTTKTVYTFTYQDPTYYLRTSNPSYTLMSHLPTATKNADGTYNPAPTGAVYKVDAKTNTIIKTYNSTVPSGLYSFYIQKAIKDNMVTALTDADTAKDIGLVFKVTNEAQPTVITSYGTPLANGTLTDNNILVDATTFDVTFSSSDLNGLIATNMDLAKKANPITGVVYKANYAAPLSQKKMATYPANGLPLAPVAPATTVSAADIENFASQNMVNALQAPENAGLKPSRKLMNMSSVIGAYDQTIQQFLLAQNQTTGVYSLYQPSATNGGTALATYGIMPSSVWKSYVLDFVGTRTAGTTSVPARDNTFDSVILLQNVKTGNIDNVVCMGSLFSAQSVGSSTYANVSDNSQSLTLSFKDYSALLGITPATKDPQGNLLWPADAPALAKNNPQYISITMPDYYGGTGQTSEYIYQWVYPAADVNAMPNLLNTLKITMVGSSSGVAVPVMGLNTANLKPVAVAPADGGYASALTSLTTAYNSAIALAIAAQTNVTNTATSVQSDATSTHYIIPVPTTGQCPDGYESFISQTNNKAYCRIANPLVTAQDTSSANAPLLASSLLNTQKTSTTQTLTQTEAGAKGLIADLQKAIAAGGSVPTLLSTRTTNRSTALKNLYYQVVSMIDPSGNTIQGVRLYYKVGFPDMSVLSGNNIAIGNYVQYPIGTEKVGYIYNGKDAQGNLIDATLQDGAPTGYTLSSADMAALQGLVGKMVDPTVFQATTDVLSKNAVLTLTAGSKTLNNYLYFGDLLP